MATAKTASEIQELIDAAEVELADRRSQLVGAERKVVQIESEYDSQSDLAINYNDTDAKKWLKKADQDLSDAKVAVKQFGGAARAIAERIVRLESEKAEAVHASIAAEIESETSALIGDAVALDGAVVAFRTAQDAILIRRDRIIELARKIGADVRVLEKLPDHLRRNVNSQLFGRSSDNVWMAKAVRDMYAQPFSKFLENILRPADQPDATEDELLADAKKASNN